MRSVQGKRYMLRCSRDGEWTLRSGYDGAELLSRPGIEMITVDSKTLREAESRIVGCEPCRGDDADHLFDAILADVIGKHGAFVEANKHRSRPRRSGKFRRSPKS